MVAGAGLLAAPARPIAMWNRRITGDAVDLAALGGATRQSPRSTNVWSTIAFVLSATALDLFVVRGLSRAS